mmetsp:Transcript_12341/g.23243  ORF Transcript_12341/g.23243 Transcript_12341/m.23243 type:complete len:313 (-) Transcript_12341:50-988(-)
MYATALVLGCLIFGAHGRRGPTTGKVEQSLSREQTVASISGNAFSLLLLALNPAGAFNPCGQVARLHRHDALQPLANTAWKTHAGMSHLGELVSDCVTKQRHFAESAVLPTSRVGTPAMLFGKDKTRGATTVVLTIGFRINERGPKSILGKLDALADAADTSTAEGIAELAGDTALMLLRSSNEWISTCGSATHKRDDDTALADFDRMVVKEAAKFDEREFDSPSGKAKSDTLSTLGVVSVVACLMGDREEEIQSSFQGGVSAMKTALEELSAASNDVESIFGFELLWVPGGDDEVLNEEEVIIDWPELMPC